MDNYKSNSDKSKVTPTRTKVEPVISGTATLKKKSEFKKFTEALITRDFASIRSYVIGDVLIPAGKKAIEELVHMILHGEASRGTRTETAASKVSYRSYWDKRDDAMRLDARNAPARAAYSRPGYSYEDVSFETLRDAIEVQDRINEMISMFGVASIADLYDMARISDDNYTNNNYGWSDISSSETIATSDGRFTLKMPVAMPITKL